MSRFQPFAHPDRKIEVREGVHSVCGLRLGKQLLEGSTCEQRHDQEGLAFVLAEFVDRAYVGMLESGRRSRLKFEAA